MMLFHEKLRPSKIQLRVDLDIVKGISFETKAAGGFGIKSVVIFQVPQADSRKPAFCWTGAKAVAAGRAIPLIQMVLLVLSY